VLLHDALTMRWKEIGLMADPEAVPVTEVGTDQASGGGDAAACTAGGAVSTCETATGSRPVAHETVTAAELAQLLDDRATGATSFVLVDVREDWERRLVSIPGSVPVPFDELRGRGAEALPAEARGESLVLHCKAGTRSAKALAALRSHFAAREETLRHLDGGVLAWVDEVVPDQPRY